MDTPQYTFSPVGTIHSCYGEKFGIPRQSGLVESATATLELLPPCNTPEALRRIGEFSHLWIVFIFHRSEHNPSKVTARPPRLGGNERVGVFASRSPFRPNPIGLSVVELLEVDGIRLKLGGGDFLDGTPVLDIKPYIPYADSIPGANGAYADQPPEAANRVVFSPEAQRAVQALENESRPALRQLICDMLAYNPRPAYQTDAPDRLFGTRLFDIEVRWKQSGGDIQVVEMEKSKDS